MPRHTFHATYEGDRPASGHATRAVIRITKPDGDVIPLVLTPAELRSLQRAALLGLGYTKVDRSTGQWDTTWQGDIEKKIDPILVVTKATFPVPSKKAKTG